MVGMNRKISARSAAIITVLTACILPLAAVAGPNIDGRFDPTEGYTTGYNVDFAIEGGGSIGGGELWTYVDGAGDVYIAFNQPTDLVDNSYGTGQVGWGAGSPSGKNHKFTDLLNSDQAEFFIKNAAGDVILDVTLDYLMETGAEPSGYGAGIKSEVPSGTGYIMEIGTSLDYNFNDKGYELTTNSPDTVSDSDYTLVDGTYEGWIFDVTYELKISGDAFEPGGFDVSKLTIDLVHDSPNKMGKNKVWPEIDGEINGNGPPPSGYIPEPLTIFAVFGGVVGLVGYIRKRFGPTAC